MNMENRFTEQNNILERTMKTALYPLFILLASLWGCGYVHTTGEELPKKDHAHLVIDREGGIKGLCRLGQASNRAVKNLGRPDKYYRDTFWLGTWHVYRYEDLGLAFDARHGILDSIRIEFNEKSTARLRFHDEQPLNHPVSTEQLTRLFGPPKEIQRFDQDKVKVTGMRFEFPGCYFHFNVEDDAVTSLYIDSN